MTSDNDKKAAEEYLKKKDPFNGLTTQEQTYLKCDFRAGLEHKEKQLMPIIESLEKRVIMKEEEIVKRLIENKVIRYV